MLQGFASTMDAIIENLPTTRQTMLFSATQTKRVRYSFVPELTCCMHKQADIQSKLQRASTLGLHDDPDSHSLMAERRSLEASAHAG